MSSRSVYLVAVLAIGLFLAMQQACHWRGRSGPAAGEFATTFPDNLSRELKEVLPSVQEVVSVLDYEIQEYHYAKRNGRLIPDANSLLGYKLDTSARDQGISKRREVTTSFGGGIIIGQNSRELLILTSRHVIVHDDTITKFLYQNGTRTDTPLVRAILKKEELGVRDAKNLIRPARIVAEETRSDLAMISFSAEGFAASAPYQGRISSERIPELGQFAVIIGYPQEILQVSAGLTSDSPYPGNFSVSVGGTFGYSGGPVFLYSSVHGLQLAGICKSIPGKRIYYVSPDSTNQFTGELLPEDFSQLRIEMTTIFNHQRIYAVTMDFILRFLSESLPVLKMDNFRLSFQLQEALSAKRK